MTFDGTGGAMRVNGEEIPNSARQPRDAGGRPLSPWAGETIPPHQALLMSDYDPDLFDGRYYGPLPESAIYAYTEPVLTNFWEVRATAPRGSGSGRSSWGPT